MGVPFHCTEDYLKSTCRWRNTIKLKPNKQNPQKYQTPKPQNPPKNPKQVEKRTSCDNPYSVIYYMYYGWIVSFIVFNLKNTYNHLEKSQQ